MTTLLNFLHYSCIERVKIGFWLGDSKPTKICCARTRTIWNKLELNNKLYNVQIIEYDSSNLEYQLQIATKNGIAQYI